MWAARPGIAAPARQGRYLRRRWPCSPGPAVAGTKAEGECDAGQGQQQRPSRAPPGRPAPRRNPWSVAGGQGRGEKVREQLVDALGLVVMHPVRGVGQALNAVQAGHVVAVGFGQFGAEVVIALARASLTLRNKKTGCRMPSHGRGGARQWPARRSMSRTPRVRAPADEGADHGSHRARPRPAQNGGRRVRQAPPNR